MNLALFPILLFLSFVSCSGIIPNQIKGSGSATQNQNNLEKITFNLQPSIIQSSSSLILEGNGIFFDSQSFLPLQSIQKQNSQAVSIEEYVRLQESETDKKISAKAAKFLKPSQKICLEKTVWVAANSFWCLGKTEIVKGFFNESSLVLSESKFLLSKVFSADETVKIVGVEKSAVTLLGVSSRKLIVIVFEESGLSFATFAVPPALQPKDFDLLSGGTVQKKPWLKLAETLFLFESATGNLPNWSTKRIEFLLDKKPLENILFSALLFHSFEGKNWNVFATAFVNNNFYTANGNGTVVNMIAAPKSIGENSSPDSVEAETEAGVSEGGNVATAPLDTYWTSKGKQVMQTYCTSCHTYKHSYGGAVPDLTLVVGLKTEIISRIGKAANTAGTMPPYGQPRVPEVELTEFRNWLQGK